MEGLFCPVKLKFSLSRGREEQISVFLKFRDKKNNKAEKEKKEEVEKYVYSHTLIYPTRCESSWA